MHSDGTYKLVSWHRPLDHLVDVLSDCLYVLVRVTVLSRRPVPAVSGARHQREIIRHVAHLPHSGNERWDHGAACVPYRSGDATDLPGPSGRRGRGGRRGTRCAGPWPWACRQRRRWGGGGVGAGRDHDRGFQQGGRAPTKRNSALDRSGGSGRGAIESDESESESDVESGISSVTT